MDEYSNIQTGACGLLYETTSLLNKLDVKYIIVGGWSPYLLNSKPISHPGTKDVDVFFEGGYEKHSLKKIILEFLHNDFILSAKHDFQLFKIIKVDGNEFVYNVDLLHPFESIEKKEIYVEQIDLGIPADKYRSQTFRIKSILLPDSQSLFTYNMFIDFQIEITTVQSKIQKQTIPLMSELGTLITKSKSVLIEKRYRDALDIYLTIKQSQNFDLLIESIINLRKENLDTYNVLYDIRKAHEENILFEKTSRFIEVEKNQFLETFQNFFYKTGLDKMAL